MFKRKIVYIKTKKFPYIIKQFERIQLLQTRWFSIYIHKLYESDPSIHLHNHANPFYVLVLAGCYKEKMNRMTHRILRQRFDLYKIMPNDCHHLQCVSVNPSTMLILQRNITTDSTWHYVTEDGLVESSQYITENNNVIEISK